MAIHSAPNSPFKRCRADRIGLLGRSSASVDEPDTIPAKNCRRLVVVGSARVGKTSLVQRFLHGKFEDSYTPTIEDFHSKIYRIRGEAYRLDILDTSGNHPFPAMRRLSLLTGDLFVLVYALDQRETFEEVKQLQKQILESKIGRLGQGKSKNCIIPMVFVGNKCEQDEREIGEDEARELANLYPGCANVEASAKININVEEIFVKLFMLAKLPTEMSPNLHRKVAPSFIGFRRSQSSDSEEDSCKDSFRRRMTMRRRMSDACGAVTPNARRPSIRTDLLLMQARKAHGGSFESAAHNKCSIM